MQNGQFTRDYSGAAQDTGGIFPRFYIEPEQDHAASEKEGRPIYRDREFVEYVIAGNQLTRPVERVTPDIRKRFAQHYAAFKESGEESLIGTPIEQWPPLAKRQVAEMKAIGINTVEMLAAVSDDNLAMGWRELRAKAQRFIDDARGNAASDALAAENERLREQLTLVEKNATNMASLMADMKGRLDALEAPKAPMPTGR